MWKIIKLPRIQLCRSFSSTLQTSEATSDAAKYPAILDNSILARRARKKQEWFDKIRKIPTIEEKLLELNMPRYYGYRCLMLDDRHLPYNAMPFIQYITNTEFNELKENPDELKRVDEFYNLIKSDLVDALEFECSGYNYGFKDRHEYLKKDQMYRVQASGVVKHLNRVLTRTLGSDFAHLHEADTDIDPRIEAFWFVGGITPPLNVVRWRGERKSMSKYKNEPVDRTIQYRGSPMLALRHQHPLEPFDNPNFSEPNQNIPMDVKNTDPRACGYLTEHRHGVTVPGFWPGNVREYGLLSYHDRSVVLNRKDSYGIEDNKMALKAEGILTSFAYTFGQACYQGFSTFDDITYPLSAQTILTDGKKWSFYRYQLNSTVTHTHAFPDEPHYKYNQCWGTEEMNLYEHCDENGKIHGLNDDVFKQLIRFYLTQPKQRDYDMKPYLDSQEKKIADIEDVERRAWLENSYKYVTANRKRQLSVPEIYDWEKIYKIDNKTRPMDKKRRFFELKINPFARTLDEHRPEYIPRYLRPNGIYDSKELRATYYPLNHRSNDPRTQSHSEFGAAKSGIRRKYDRSKQSLK